MVAQEYSSTWEPAHRTPHEWPSDHVTLDCLFYSEAEAAALLGIHRTTLRTLALAGHAPIEPIALTEHRRVYRRIDIERLAGIAT
ncbi:hypothetical protein [Microbacterium sp.]|uniref:hypothetical protein n=1 Tax=Microbacterium sp. TaxID=51671 RepID=UPI00092AA2AC|nr:hypothetical protein [Microbacterium sp.]MBN9187287.1 hypothetical protein [Microbacterium sp.]MBN9193732.1 hypothetical protein [Microbacterium sp.]OJU57376.1 MAG: hypothetical protein BGO04_15100 [Microbacterium sp. 70-38]